MINSPVLGIGLSSVFVVVRYSVYRVSFGSEKSLFYNGTQSLLYNTSNRDLWFSFN